MFMNIFPSFISNELVTFPDKDLPCMNYYVKYQIKWKNEIYKMYAKIGHIYIDYLKFQRASNTMNQIIIKTKNVYNHMLALNLS